MSDSSGDAAFASRRGRRPRPLAGPRHVAMTALPLWRWSTPVFRICKAHREPLYFGREGKNRFDAPQGEFGVLYAAETPEGAFVETCIRERPAGNLFVMSYFQERKLAEISFPTPLRLVDLAGPGLSLLGADNRLTTGSYRIAQRWSRAFWSHADCPDGILYCSRFNPALRCLALFDRAGSGCLLREGSRLPRRSSKSELFGGDAGSLPFVPVISRPLSRSRPPPPLPQRCCESFAAGAALLSCHPAAALRCRPSLSRAGWAPGSGEG